MAYPDCIYTTKQFDTGWAVIDKGTIFVPFGHYDEPEILPYAIRLICPIGADVRQSLHLGKS